MGDDTFECRFGMGDNVTRGDALKRAAEQCDEYFGETPYRMEVDVERHMTMGGGVSHHMVTVRAVPDQ